MNASKPTTTVDALCQGSLTFQQPKAGYRFSIDAVLLAAYAKPRTGDLVLDVGTGCGVAALLMARRDETLTIYGIELQRELARLARQNAACNGLADQVHVLEGDVNLLAPSAFPRPIDLIVTNPPYYRLASGRLNPDDQRAVARHELHLTLEQLMAAAKRLLRTGGRFVCVYASERLTDLLTGMRQHGIEPKILRMVHGKLGDAARLCVVEGVQRGRPGLTVAAPLVIYGEDGAYTEAVRVYLET